MSFNILTLKNNKAVLKMLIRIKIVELSKQPLSIAYRGKEKN